MQEELDAGAVEEDERFNPANETCKYRTRLLQYPHRRNAHTLILLYSSNIQLVHTSVVFALLLHALHAV